MENRDKKRKEYLENVKEHRVKEKNLVFGIRAVMEAIDAGKEFDRILVRRDMSSTIARQLMEALKEKNLSIQRVPQEKLNRLTEKNHQGVIAFLSEITYHHLEDILPLIYEEGRSPFLMILDGVTDVRNFGAIARTCECAGVDAIVIPAQGSAAINADAIKTSAGALHRIPVCRVQNLQAALQFLTASGLRIVAATEKGTALYTKIDCSTPLAVVMGSEDEGISPETLRLCNDQVYLPINGEIASLNVSVAAGVLAYEVLRQRNLSK